MKNIYYVYIYYRLDTNEPFYVGKGKGDRWKETFDSRRSKHFMNIINKYPFVVEIVKNDLTEEEAFYLEEEIIKILVFEYGYSIDIKGNRSTERGCHLVNQTWGGEGASGFDFREKMSSKQIETWRKKLSESHKGENHPNYGKHLNEKIKNKISEGVKNAYLSMTEDEKIEKATRIKENCKKRLYNIYDNDNNFIACKCGYEIYNDKSKGFLNIGRNSFIKYIMNNGGIVDISLLNSNNPSIVSLKEKLKRFNGWKFKLVQSA